MRPPVQIQAFNQQHSAKGWQQVTGIKAATIRYRMRKGWTPEAATQDSATIGNNGHLRTL